MFKKSLSLLLIFVLVFSASCLSFAEKEEKEGSLVIVGGALDPNNEEIYNKFIELGGGKDKIRIAIIPTASGSPVTSANSYKEDFIKYGIKGDRIDIIPIAVKDDKNTKDIDESKWAKNGFNKKIAKDLKKYNAVFFVGGDQLRIVNCLVDKKGKDGPVLKSIREIYKKGGVIGGSSAGAAIMSDPMICGGTSLGALKEGVIYEDKAGDNRVFLTKGLGFFENGLVDQHFIKRGRLGRLIVACFEKKTNYGFGIDEDTAMVVKKDEVQAIGESGIMMVDISNAKRDLKSHTLKASNIKINYMEKGDKFNLKTKEITPNKLKEETTGYEYYDGNSLDTNIFGLDSIKNVITYDLVDNTSDKAVGISFDMEEDMKGSGVQLTFRKAKDTKGYYGKINGKESYTVANVYLDIEPISVKINK